MKSLILSVMVAVSVLGFVVTMINGEYVVTRIGAGIFILAPLGMYQLISKIEEWSK